MVTAMIKAESDFLNGDCPVASSSADFQVTRQMNLDTLDTDVNPLHKALATKVKREQDAAAPVPLKKVKIENPRGKPQALSRIEAGSYVANKAGMPICPGWQNGSCRSPCPQNMSHQCSKCLQNAHGAFTPRHCPHIAGTPGAPSPMNTRSKFNAKGGNRKGNGKGGKAKGGNRKGS